MHKLILNEMKNKDVSMYQLSEAVKVPTTYMKEKFENQSDFTHLQLSRIIQKLELQEHIKELRDKNRECRRLRYQGQKKGRWEIYENMESENLIALKNYIQDNIDTKSIKEIAAETDETMKVIKYVIKEYDIKKYKEWTAEEVQYLVNNHMKETIDIATEMAKDIKDVELNLQKHKHRLRKETRFLKDHNIKIGNRYMCKNLGEGKEKIVQMGECIALKEYDNYILFRKVKSGVKECVLKADILSREYLVKEM